MKKNIKLLLSMLIIFLSFYLIYVKTTILTSIIIVFGSFIALYIVSFIVTKFLSKISLFFEKYYYIHFLIVSLIYIVISLLFRDYSILILCGTIISSLFLSLIIRRKVNNYYAIITCITYYLLSVIFNSNQFLSFIPIIIIYILEFLDNKELRSKKNIIKLLLMFICVLCLGLYFSYGLIIILPVLYYFYKKKNNIFLFIAFIIISLLSIFINIKFNLNIIFFSNNNNIIYLSILSLLSGLIMLLNRNKNIRLIYYYLLFECLIALIIDCKIDVTFMIPIYFLIIGQFLITFRDLSINISMYFTPKKIKKVSVVVPNYNYAQYINLRIDSIINQKYPIYELIILDDCSTDDSDSIIKNRVNELKNKYSNTIIKYIPNKTNSGNVFKQWLKAFEVCSGDYLWIAEADDLCSKYFLNLVMRGFDNPDVVLSYCESNAIDQDGIEYKKNLRDWYDEFNSGRWNINYISEGKKELDEALCTNNTIANVSSVVFKLDSNINVNKYLSEASDYRLAGDWYFYSKYLLHGSIAYYTSSLNYHRIHRNSVTTTTDAFKRYLEIKKVQDSIGKDIKLSSYAKLRIQNTLERFCRINAISNDELKYHDISLSSLCKKNHVEDEVLLSIIIPVYNVEKYIKKCISSFISSLPEKTEVIIINDGSTDNSELIIKEYAKKYSQIKYIKKSNGGLSSVKNRGLKEAKGRYIIFLDSDDYVSSNMYDTMLKKAIDTSSDLVYCDVFMVYETGDFKYCTMQNYSRKEKLLKIIDNPLMAASWNKLVKKDLYNNLKFPEGINNEDIAVSPLLILNSKKISYIPSPFYKYVQRSGSIQNSGFSEKRFMIFDTSQMLFNSIKEYSKSIREQIIGAIVTHQLLAILIYPISNIKDNSERIKYIELFVQRYNSLNIDNTNKYIVEYLKYHNMKDIVFLIQEEKILQIDNMILSRKEKTKWIK